MTSAKNVATALVHATSRAAGIGARISPHSLRHTYVTQLLDAGASLRDAQIGARHADPRITMRYDRARTRYLPVKGVKPPFRKLWRFTDRPLLEFPPIYVAGRLYFVNNSGFAHSLDADTGKELWKRRIGRLNASSPAYAKGRLYIVNLVPGHVLKLDAKTGRTIWKRRPMMKARRNLLLTSSGVALVAMSKSLGLMPSSRSRTAPPTRKALKPASCSVCVTRTALFDTSAGLMPCSCGP